MPVTVDRRFAVRIYRVVNPDGECDRLRGKCCVKCTHTLIEDVCGTATVFDACALHKIVAGFKDFGKIDIVAHLRPFLPTQSAETRYCLQVYDTICKTIVNRISDIFLIFKYKNLSFFEIRAEPPCVSAKNEKTGRNDAFAPPCPP